MKLKILPVLYAAVLLTTTTVCADTTINEGDLVDNRKDVDVKVTAEINSTFTVSLPSNLRLTSDGSQYTYSTTVGVKGDISVDSAIMVEPNIDVNLYDVTNRPEDTDGYDGYEHKDPGIATVSQLETEWTYDVLSRGVSSGNFIYNDDSQYYNTELTLTASDLSAGEWEGALTYNISLVSTRQAAGLYDADDNLLVAWEDSGIDVSIGYEYDNYKTLTTSSYYVITNNYPTTKKVIIPSSITSIGSHAFTGCSGLTTVVIPNSVTSISEYAFYKCAALTSVTIPDSITTISKDTFNDCTSLTSVTIPSSVTSIGTNAFAYCTSLTSVTIPDSVTSIDSWAFQNCKCLTAVTIPDSVTSIGGNAFYQVPHIYYNGSATGRPWGARAIN